MFQVREGQFSNFWISDGIVHFIYQDIPLLNLEIAEAILRERMQFQAGMAYPILCNTSGIIDADMAARNYLAKEGSTLAKAVALVDQRIISQGMMQLYIQRNKPLVPTSVFDNNYDAIQFLKKYI